MQKGVCVHCRFAPITPFPPCRTHGMKPHAHHRYTTIDRRSPDGMTPSNVKSHNTTMQHAQSNTARIPPAKLRNNTRHALNTRQDTQMHRAQISKVQNTRITRHENVGPAFADSPSMPCLNCHTTFRQPLHKASQLHTQGHIRRIKKMACPIGRTSCV